MKKDIQTAIRYFIQFNYAPTADEIYTFLSIKTEKNYFLNKISHLINEKQIISILDSPTRYTLPGYIMDKSTLKNKQNRAQIKASSIRSYVQILRLFPSIQVIGLSGSVAMNNASITDDIDLFIITRQHRLWTARFIANGLAFCMGKKRSRSTSKNKAHNKICLNMFIDTNSLKMPLYKQNKYIAHEILQMKPLVSKNNMYQRFLNSNRWIYTIYPNGPKPILAKEYNQKIKVPRRIVGNAFEKILKFIQLAYMSKRRTKERIFKGQLWFHPHDFEDEVVF